MSLSYPKISHAKDRPDSFHPGRSFLLASGAARRLPTSLRPALSLHQGPSPRDDQHDANDRSIDHPLTEERTDGEYGKKNRTDSTIKMLIGISSHLFRPPSQ